jgi:hypothetical protein
MWKRTTVALATVIAVGCASIGSADAHKSRKRHVNYAGQYVGQPLQPAPYYGGRLVEHPAFNIACMTRDRATRALPCDQPVWVYGSPCEIDLGLGRYRSCD